MQKDINMERKRKKYRLLLSICLIACFFQFTYFMKFLNEDDNFSEAGSVQAQSNLLEK